MRPLFFSANSMPLQLWSLRCSWGWKKCFLCTKHKRDVLWAQTLCCAAWGGEKRWRRGKGGGNWHIKEKEFKINLISQSLSPPPRGLQWACSVLLWDTRRAQREWTRDEERREWGSDRSNKLASSQKRQLWIKMSELVVPFLCMCVWSWT